MQRAKASAPFGPVAVEEVPLAAPGEPPPQPAARTATTTVAMVAAMGKLAAFRFMGCSVQGDRDAPASPVYQAAHDGSRTATVRRLSSAGVQNVQVRVLVVEDHVALADRIGEGLRDAGFAVDVVNDGAAALQSTTTVDYDVVVLDRDLPSVHGDRVCRQLVRDGSPSRILMLTAAADVEDRVDGLELGADDYLGKPFAFHELIARIRALGRRVPGSPAVVQRGDLVVDLARHRASRARTPLTLTRKEFGVLERLAGADGAAVSAEELLEHVWDANADPFSNTVAVTIGRLRRKLGDPPLIETVVGVGYRL
jgi:DNA-binding response OmpR family regulator